MRGDFSRSTFWQSNRYSSVLMQQGRVLLDADFNEQAAILLHMLRALAADMIGPNEPEALFKHGGPGTSFMADVEDGKLYVAKGHYYVDGILCENDQDQAYFDDQSQWPQPEPISLDTGDYLVYLDVWERLITPLEKDYIREVALLGADTCVRSQVVWQIKLMQYGAATAGRSSRARKAAAAAADRPESLEAALLALSQMHSSGMLTAGLKSAENDPDPCITPPDSRYRGQENQLYRVEIHTGGTADVATFKWSRDNGSVTFPILSYMPGTTTSTFQLGHLGRDYRSSLEPGDWVEALDDGYVLREQSGMLLRITDVNHDDNTITVEGVLDDIIELDMNPLLRRWDHHYPSNDVHMAPDKAFKLEAGHWRELENGIVVRFENDDPDSKALVTYCHGDYWLIPARTITGLIEWPGIPRSASLTAKLEGDMLPPQGVQHHYAPLATIQVGAGGMISDIFQTYKGKDTDDNEVELPLRRSLASIPLMSATS